MSVDPKKCDGLCRGLCQENTHTCDHIHEFVKWNAVQPPVDLAAPMQVLINIRNGATTIGNIPRFQLSELALTIYKFITEMDKYTLSSEDNLFRIDLTMIKICKYLGSEADGRYCDLYLETVKPGYETYYRIEKDDGWEESIVYNTEAYTLSQICTIVKDATRSDSERVAAIAAILDP